MVCSKALYLIPEASVNGRPQRYLELLHLMVSLMRKIALMVLQRTENNAFKPIKKGRKI